MAEIRCARCGQMEEALDRVPLRNELGERVLASIGRNCWQEWLRFQTALINHNGLDVREPEAREFLMQNMEAFFFRTGEAEKIDTTKQGTIEW